MEYQNISNSSLFARNTLDELVSSTVLGLCCALGVPGNIAALVMLAQHIKEDSFTPKLMLSLAVSDLLSLIFLPVWIYALLNGWVFGQGLCKLFSYVVYWSLYSSVLSVTLLSVQRYLQVLYPQRWAKLGQKGQKGLIFGIWTISGALGSYALYYRNVTKNKNGFQQCYQDYTNKQEALVVLLVETLVMFFVPLFSLLCFYHRLHQRISQSASFRSHRMTKLVIRIVVAFFVFGTPSMINNLVLMAMSWESDVSNNVTGALFFINSCVNPFLYAFSARTLRCRRKQHSDQPQQNLNETE
ncbi:leukotriene B4 receptor 1-like [Sinocyclocheilus rhinocerous]|uniref:Leukotriene B4 receptor 1-like n=1 Tax=Sinocyclocheilus rhinocerous TaxID=307959 RepID=A0A673KUL0_9TELE|nr:PREDICTED: leukotriene B4 receptor 1-like [Sinocyclocheilus rhinocerous]